MADAHFDLDRAIGLLVADGRGRCLAGRELSPIVDRGDHAGMDEAAAPTKKAEGAQHDRGLPLIVHEPNALQSAIDITVQRCAGYQNPQGAFGRRALIEQAKGVLMARHSSSADRASEMLRDHPRHNSRRLSDIAAAVVESHLLLVPFAAPRSGVGEPTSPGLRQS